MSTPKTGFSTSSYAAHERTYDTEVNQNLAQTWTKENTIDSWRHARMYQCIDPMLIEFPGARWLTVGDGRYGTDAHYLEQHHADAVATDIADGMLQRAKAAGYIKNFQKENAEQLSFEDESFDFVLCKEAYHHFPRPMIALYEMIRVAKRGVVLIEPDESPMLMSGKHILKMMVKEAMIRLGLGKRFHDRQTNIIDCGTNWYEEVGNFGYAISRREMERVALGLNFRHVAFKGLNDVYENNVEHENATEESEFFRKIKSQIAEMDRESRRGLNRSRYKLLAILIFKDKMEETFRARLAAAGYDISDLPANPYLT
jgi:ubiquinone/menaquinone biosynthesis C-methylase UbiE